MEIILNLKRKEKVLVSEETDDAKSAGYARSQSNKVTIVVSSQIRTKVDEKSIWQPVQSWHEGVKWVQGL